MHVSKGTLMMAVCGNSLVRFDCWDSPDEVTIIIHLQCVLLSVFLVLNQTCHVTVLWYIWSIDYNDYNVWTWFWFADSRHCILRARLYTKRSNISSTEMALPPRRRPMKPPISPEKINIMMIEKYEYARHLIKIRKIFLLKNTDYIYS